MDRKMNNPSWCCEQIQEKIKEWKAELEKQAILDANDYKLITAKQDMIIEIEHILYD